MRTTINLLLTSLALAALPVFAQEDPFRPVGTLDVENTWVRTGNFTQVTWDITYPATIPDLIISGPTGGIITKEELRVKMRVAGVAFQSGSTDLPVAFNTRIGAGPWQQLFQGTSNAVQASEYVFDQIVPAGTEINFGGQGQNAGGGWYAPRTTEAADIAVTGLMNGDTPPDYAPAYQQGTIESFLSSYISPDNHIQLGPRDMIYLFELASGDPGDWWFDMQDLVVIVTYEQTTAAVEEPIISQNNGFSRYERRGERRKRPQTGFMPASEPAPGDEVRD